MLLFHLVSGNTIIKTHFPLMKRVRLQFTFMVLAITILLISNVSAATVNATSCSQAHVETALNAASTGDTVVVPAGKCTWNFPVNIPTGVTLQGAGIGNTVIFTSSFIKAISLSDNSYVKGFEFTNAYIEGECSTNWVVDSCKFGSASGLGTVNLGGTSCTEHPTAVYHNCTIFSIRFVIFGTGLSKDWYTNYPDLGDTEHVFYFEGCTFESYGDYTNGIDSNYGGAKVIRFCTITDMPMGSHGGRAAVARGTVRHSMYRNNWTQSAVSNSSYAWWFRGGSGVFFDNTCTGNPDHCEYFFDFERAYDASKVICDSSTGYETVRHPEGGSPDYLCRDGIGVGKDLGLNPALPGTYNYGQKSSPIYIWNNTNNGSDGYVALTNNAERWAIENRDCFLDASSNPNYGKGGVSSGTWENRPTCNASKKNHGYWATDMGGNWNTTTEWEGADGALYVCDGVTTWVLYYTPAPYPHPLMRQTEPIGKPLSPKNLRIVASQEELSLSVTTSGNGSVDVVPNQDTYSFGQQVTLTAMADPGWVFRGWSGDLAGNDNPVTLTISGDHQVTATFADSALAYSEGFEAYNDGDDPVDWLDTAANNSMSEDNSLFQVVDIADEKVFGTASTLSNIHSHYTGSGSTVFSDYEYTGRMMMTASSGGIGVTFLSQYPVRDAYYRLRSYSSNSFHIAPHGTSITGGTTDTGVVPPANDWYRFRIWVQDTGTRTEIRAKVWPDGGAEPANWQVDAYDDSITRLTSGTFGVWSYSSGGKYWDDLMVIPFSP